MWDTRPSFCPWTAADCCPETPEQAVIDMAGYLLWAATHKRFGVCEVTVRPCRTASVICNHCGNSGLGCCCDYISELLLPGPVDSIEQIIIDGVVVDPETYRVDDYAWLVNLTDSWPQCSRPTAADDEEGSFLITYNQGIPVPAGAALVVGHLACELAKGLCDDDTCALPAGLVSLARQGVNLDFDQFDLGTRFQQRNWALFGLPIVDNWVSNVNDSRSQGSVSSPDLPQYRQTTWSFTPES
jgi:hypothetical protein